MTITIPTAYVNGFSSDIHMLLAQTYSKTRPIFPTVDAMGEKQFFERLGDLTVAPVTTRLAYNELQDPVHTRRMVTITKYAGSTYLDDLDKMRLLIDPTNEYTQRLAQAHARNFDVAMFTALGGTAYGGVDGTTATTLPSGNKIAHGSAGFTVAKFDQALKMLEEFEVDIGAGNLYLFVRPGGKEDLTGDTTNRAVSRDFISKSFYDGRTLESFHGVPIITSNLIPAIDGSTNRAYLCTSDALKVAVKRDLQVEVDKLPERGHNLQIATYMSFGAVRMEENKVIEIAYQ